MVLELRGADMMCFVAVQSANNVLKSHLSTRKILNFLAGCGGNLAIKTSFIPGRFIDCFVTLSSVVRPRDSLYY
jgi:hypothetical protein